MPDLKLRKDAIDLGILIVDEDAMLRFYRDVIGLTYVNKQATGPGGYMHRLACGSSIIKLYSPQPPVEGRSPRGVRQSTGIRYFTILVDNLDDIVRRCEAAGCEFHVPRKEFRPGEWYAQVYDPDGNVVALTQGND